MIQAPVLHDYQYALTQNIYNDWRSGNDNVLAVCPTGGGKSVIVSGIVNDGFRDGMKQSVIAHRNELVSQMAAHIARRGIPHRIIGSEQTVSLIMRQQRALFGQSFVNPSAHTAVVGVDTLMSRTNDLIQWAVQQDRWIIDEGHHVLRANKWGRATALFSNAEGLGVTATPCRADGQGLGAEYDGVYNSMVLGPTMRELIDRGFLSDYEIACPLSDLHVEDDVGASGDWSNQTLRKASKNSHIVGDVVENYCKRAYGRRAIVFATDVETAGEIANKFLQWGIRAASLSAKTPAAIREKYIQEFKDGKIWVLVNVDLFDEGFDVPACDVCIMARPTASLGKYLQMVGRALRFVPGKVALIIDHVSNIARHKLPDYHRVWSLGRRDKRGKKLDPDEIPSQVCLNPDCNLPYEKYMLCCPWCGTAKPLPEPRDRSISMVEGDLILLDRAALDAMRRAATLESAADVAQRVGQAAGGFAAKYHGNRQIEKIAEHRRLSENIAQWAAVERQRGKNDREIQRLFFHTLGMDVLTALDASRPRTEMENLANTIEGWYRKGLTVV